MVTYEQLRSIPIQQIVENLSRAHFNNYHVVVREMMDQGPISEDTSQQALSSLCTFLSFQLVHDNESGVSISPLMRFANGQASFLPEDLTSDEAAEVWRYLPEVEHAGLRAKLADMLWQSRKLRDKNHLAAFFAIDAYLALAKHVTTDAILFLERAGGIARDLGSTGRAHLQRVCTEMRRHIFATDLKDTHGLTHDLYVMLFRLQPIDFGDVADRAIEVAEFHETVAKNFDLAIPYLELVLAYHRKVQNGEGQKRIISIIVRCCIAKATFFRSAGNPFAAEAALKQAVRFSKGVVTPREMEELRTLLASVQMECLGKLKLVQAEVPNGQSIVDGVGEIVGKCGNAEEALFTLAGISSIVDVGTLRMYVDKTMKQSPLYFLATPVQLDRKGRTAAKATEKEDLQRFEMFKMLMWMIQFQGSLVIGPARERFVADHSISANGISRLLVGNPLVPDERLHLVAKGLKLGLEGDFITSLHLLVPQLENGIRNFLEQSGVATSHFVDSEVEEEKTLGGYLSHEALKKAMGESLVFTLQFVFTEKAGVNLRNNLSHGLYDPQSFYSPYAVYAWWIIMRLCLFPIERAGATMLLEG